jgi:predicted DNA-binding transcriptional regulator AlpA
MNDLDLIGTSEAAEILGIKVPQISRLRDNGKMPKPCATFAATDVWHRADVEAIKDGGEPTFGGKVTGLVGAKEAAKLLKVDRSQIGRWRRLGKFPEPAYELVAGPLWRCDDLKTWQKNRKAKTPTKGG